MDADAELEFRDFVARRAGALNQSAYLLTGDREHAEDLLQSALTAPVRGTPPPGAVVL